MRIFANREFLSASAHYDACAAKAEWGFVIGGVTLSDYPYATAWLPAIVPWGDRPL